MRVTAGGDRVGRVDFWVSYAGPDRPWAQWAAWQLKRAGFSVELDVWDWAAGDNVVLRMNDALARADRVLTLWSPAYFERDRFATDEWTAVMAQRPNKDGSRRLVPVRVTAVEPPPIVGALAYRDVFGLAEDAARAALLEAVSKEPPVPVVAPVFPGGGPGGVGLAPTGVDPGPRVPGGALPAVWRMQRRNPLFTGRAAMLARLQGRLASGGRAAVQAVHGLGGVGKTQLAVEYAHLFAGEYELVWLLDAENPDLLGQQLTELATTAGWVAADAPVTAGVAAVHEQLRHRARWLLVFDNAETAADVYPFLPAQTGHVVITSRHGGFEEIAEPVEIDVFTRPESVAYLRSRRPELGEADAARLADALGDLPLALAQAAGVLASDGMSTQDYLTELDQRTRTVLELNRPVDYPRTLAAAVLISYDRLTDHSPAAAAFLALCAYLAPEPIPLAWFSHADKALPVQLTDLASSPFAIRQAAGQAVARGLAKHTADTLQLHRLTQAVLRDHRHGTGDTDDRTHATRLIAAAEPHNDGTDPRSWPAWAALLPHLLALDPADPSLRTTACNAAWYLLSRGDYYTALTLTLTWHDRWSAILPPDDVHNLWIASQLATAHRYLGHYEAARALNEDTLARRRRVFGEDHPETLVSANNFAIVLTSLGEHEAARALNEETVARRRRVLGEDHPHTLSSANNLAASLTNLGEHEAARALNEDTLARRRRVLGEDHPGTLISANNLAIDLTSLGERQAARALREETLARRRRVLGEDHPDTLTSASNLAASLTNLGEHEAARALNEDTLARRRRVLGEDHPDTLISANNLAIDLTSLAERKAARALNEDTLARRRRVLGEDHPDTLTSASNLAASLTSLGEHESARALREDVAARRRMSAGEISG